ncbi:DUF1850 domain-containing protein [Paucisalibacillus sp. EB02]|uniref:DUF1850 domain-containing protein n=1 Tax=Paucisalibacillus sp. EB02 TaxID=1347087 RepID=UPI0004ADFA49|nr:DUF1850 domain-containing protein [Paucisalibacillus sp. EB02]
MRRKVIIMVIVILIATGIFLIPVQSGILITNLEGKPYHFFSWQSNTVTVGWRHSVELTPWKETYEILDDHKLTLESTTYKSYGAGTPDTDGKVKILKDGFIRVTGIIREIPYYSLYYVPISQYYIEDGTTQYPLKKYVPDYNHVQIHYEELNLFEWLTLHYSHSREGWTK